MEAKTNWSQAPHPQESTGAAKSKPIRKTIFIHQMAFESLGSMAIYHSLFTTFRRVVSSPPVDFFLPCPFGQIASGKT
jgi:hypothetical protein